MGCLSELGSVTEDERESGGIHRKNTNLSPPPIHPLTPPLHPGLPQTLSSLLSARQAACGFVSAPVPVLVLVPIPLFFFFLLFFKCHRARRVSCCKMPLGLAGGSAEKHSSRVSRVSVAGGESSQGAACRGWPGQHAQRWSAATLNHPTLPHPTPIHTHLSPSPRVCRGGGAAGAGGSTLLLLFSFSPSRHSTSLLSFFFCPPVTPFNTHTHTHTHTLTHTLTCVNQTIPSPFKLPASPSPHRHTHTHTHTHTHRLGGS